MHNQYVHEMRDEIKTFLNHIMGYSDILQEDARDLHKEKILESAGKIRQETETVKQALDQFFSAGESGKDFDVDHFKKQFFTSLYVIVGLTQGLKKRCEEIEADYFIPDIDRILSSVNRLFDFVEKEIRLLLLGDAAGDSEVRETVPEMPEVQEFSSVSEGLTGSLLLVDDSEPSREILKRHLERQGHRVTSASGGAEALSLLETATFDLIILDYMMPGMNGYQVLKRIKEEEQWSHIPVIMISAVEEMDSVASCIELGAEDYLPKQFNPVLLQARIGISLEKKRLRDQEFLYMKALLESQNVLAGELSDAADYVRGLLPAPMEAGPVRADWLFLPSAQLGGDCFNYYWVDEDCLVFYLMDVSGHGVRAALLSVSIMNLLHSRTLSGDDLKNPAEVLTYLNRNFQMEEQNNMYFSLWYGVYHRKTGVLRFSSAGAPPALLIRKEDGEAGNPQRLLSRNPIVGMDQEAAYSVQETETARGDQLLLFSDGVYEVERKDGAMMDYDKFVSLVSSGDTEDLEVEKILNRIEGYTQRTSFDDDFSLVLFQF